MEKYSSLIFNIFRKKKLCKFSISLFFILILFYILILGLRNGIKDIYLDVQKENIEYNYMIIGSTNKYDKIKEDIAEITYIKQYYPLIQINNGEYTFTYFDNNLIDLKDGSFIKDKYDAIIPNSLKKNVNEYIEAHINNVAYKLKVTGTYNSDEFKFNFNNASDNIIISQELLKEINDINDNNLVIVEVDDYSNIDTVVNQFKNLNNYEISIYDVPGNAVQRYYDFYNNISRLSNVLIIFVFFFMIIVNSVIIKDSKTDIAIMKSIGYSNFKISLLFIIYSLMLIFIALIPSFIIAIIISLLLKQIIIINSIIFIKLLRDLMIAILLVIFISNLIIEKINIIKLIKN